MSALNTSSCATLLQSLSSFLGPPSSRRNKFVGERKGESWHFEITRDPLKVIDYAASPGLLSTALGCILRELSKETFNLGITWTVVFTVSLYAKLRQHLLDQCSFPAQQVKLCVGKIGKECLALAEELKMDAEDIEEYQFCLPHSHQPVDSVEDETSWFFHETGVDLDPTNKGEGAAEKGNFAKFLACLCKTLYSGGQIEVGSDEDGADSCVVTERLCQQLLMMSLATDAALEMKSLMEAVHALLGCNGANRENLEVLEVVGPGDQCSFVTPGVVFPVTRMSEIVVASDRLPLHDLSSEQDLASCLSSKARVILVSGNLTLSTIATCFQRKNAGKSSMQRGSFEEDKAEIEKELSAYCNEILKRDLQISLLLVEGSVDCHVELELRKQGVLVITCLGSEALFKASKVSESFVLANFFSIEERHVGEIYLSLLRSYGSNVPSSSSYVPKLSKTNEPCDRDTYFIAARPLDSMRRRRRQKGATGSHQNPPICTVVICSLLENQCDFLAQEVRQLANRALVCLSKGFLPGNGRFERSLIETLNRRQKKAGEVHSNILRDLVLRSFVLALEEVHELSLQNCGSSFHDPSDESYVHFDSFHERHCGIKRAIEMLVAILVTENVVINKQN